MADGNEIRQLISVSQAVIERDVAALRTMLQGLSRTKAVIERATLAYFASVRALQNAEQLSSNSRLNAPNPPPPLASPLARSDF